MSRTYQGGIITNSPATPTGPFQCGTAPGIWTIDQMLAWQKAGVWPTAGNIAVGTFAIFALGYVSSTYTATTNKYTYSGDLNAAATSLTGATFAGAAAGNSTRGIFALGYAPGSSASRSKYTYNGCVVSTGTAASFPSLKSAATGNSTVGIFALGKKCGSQSSNRCKYTYSGDTNSIGAYAITCSFDGTAVGNCSVGIFALGNYTCCCSSVGMTNRNKYTYSSCTNGSATAASSAAGCRGAASGNSTVGIFALGGATTTRNKYTYSGDVNAVATSSSVVSNFGAAAGNSTIGIFAIGQNLTTRNKYTYSGCTSATATAASSGNYYGSAASNGTTGVNT